MIPLNTACTSNISVQSTVFPKKREDCVAVRNIEDAHVFPASRMWKAKSFWQDTLFSIAT